MARQRKFTNHNCTAIKLPKEFKQQLEHFAQLLDSGYQINADIINPKTEELVESITYTSSAIVQAIPSGSKDSINPINNPTDGLNSQQDSSKIRVSMVTIAPEESQSDVNLIALLSQAPDHLIFNNLVKQMGTIASANQMSPGSTPQIVAQFISAIVATSPSTIPQPINANSLERQPSNVVLHSSHPQELVQQMLHQAAIELFILRILLSHFKPVLTSCPDPLDSLPASEGSMKEAIEHEAVSSKAPFIPPMPTAADENISEAAETREAIAYAIEMSLSENLTLNRFSTSGLGLIIETEMNEDLEASIKPGVVASLEAGTKDATAVLASSIKYIVTGVAEPFPSLIPITTAKTLENCFALELPRVAIAKEMEDKAPAADTSALLVKALEATSTNPPTVHPSYSLEDIKSFTHKVLKAWRTLALNKTGNQSPWGTEVLLEEIYDSTFRHVLLGESFFKLLSLAQASSSAWGYQMELRSIPSDPKRSFSLFKSHVYTDITFTLTNGSLFSSQEASSVNSTNFDQPPVPSGVLDSDSLSSSLSNAQVQSHLNLAQPSHNRQVHPKTGLSSKGILAAVSKLLKRSVN